jgi:hypothetical protein
MGLKDKASPAALQDVVGKTFWLGQALYSHRFTPSSEQGMSA